jgi:hypothetical protein
MVNYSEQRHANLIRTFPRVGSIDYETGQRPLDGSMRKTTHRNHTQGVANMHYRPLLVLIITILFFGAGCTVVHTVPLAARRGDTIMISVGSPDDLSEANITSITYYPDSGTPVVVPNSNIRSIFKLYPDKTSAAWLYSDATLIENDSGHGPWTVVIALDLPDDGTLPVGTGHIQVSTTAQYSGNVPGVNNHDIALEILPSTATSPQPSTFDYLGFGGVELAGDLNELRSLPRLEFKPSFTGYDAVHTYGAVEIKIGIDKSGIAEDDFNIVVDDKIGTTQTRNVHAFWNAKRYETSVYFISPTGELQYSDVDFSIVSKALQNQFETGAQDVDTDVTISYTWYDMNGAVAPTQPPITLVNLTGT